jgi:hypothetical protein
MTGYLTSPQLSGLNRNHTLTDLDSGTKYYYQAFAYNSTDQSLFSNSSIQNFTTSANKTDSFNISVLVNGVEEWHNGSSTTYIDISNNNTEGVTINATIWAYNNSGSLSDPAFWNEYIPAPTYTPPSTISATIGNFQINHTLSAEAENITDSFNVSVVN